MEKKKKSNNILLQVQNNFVSLSYKALVKSYSPQKDQQLTFNLKIFSSKILMLF